MLILDNLKDYFMRFFLLNNRQFIDILMTTCRSNGFVNVEPNNGKKQFNVSCSSKLKIKNLSAFFYYYVLVVAIMAPYRVFQL